MKVELTNELFWLAATLLMTTLFWVPYIINRMKEQGIWNALYDPHGDTKALAPWAKRMMCAHQNAVENLVLFAPLVLMLYALGISTESTALACAIYFFARAVHYIVFTFGIPLLRVITFLIGFSCQLFLALKVLNVV